MASLWDEIKKAVKDGMSIAAEKTEEYTKIGKIKLEAVTIKSAIAKKFSELGGRAYTLLVEENKDTIKDDSEIKSIIEEIKKYEAELKAKERKAEDIQKEESAKTESTET